MNARSAVARAFERMSPVMKRTTSTLSGVAMVAGVLALGVPTLVAAQRHQGAQGGGERDSGGRGGDRAVPRGPSGGGATSSPQPVRGGGNAPATAPRSSESERTEEGGRARPSSRQRGGQAPVDTAVPRRGVPPSGGRPIIIDRGGYYSGYYPWGYGGYGFGGYYGGYYDPWYYGGGYGYPAYYSTGYEGSLRIKVKPRDAAVFVDGYFAGQVDEFDGVFQRLRVEPGPHRVEIRADGYEPLSFEVRIPPGGRVNYTGELRRVP